MVCNLLKAQFFYAKFYPSINVTKLGNVFSTLVVVLVVMGSGSKSRVWVEFEYCLSGSGRVRVYTFRFLSGSGNFSRVRVGFSGFKIWNF